ncbi:MAG: hypothetical protein VB108_04690 [Anaerolineaceae bacterium]|nr:hypothetical protein [Anaerolineaceae bacterium]
MKKVELLVGQGLGLGTFPHAERGIRKGGVRAERWLFSVFNEESFELQGEKLLILREKK